jgi:Ca2+-binding EF-hand superfamily protein
MNLDFGEFCPDDIYMFFKRYDRSGRGRLTFNEFSEAVLPFSQEYAGLVTDRPEYYLRRGHDYRRFFNCDTRMEIQELWKVIFRGERAIEVLREQISKRPYLDFRAAFRCIDKDGDEFVRSWELRDFLADSGFYATERELQGLMYRLDHLANGRVTQEKFSEALTPKLTQHF